MEPKKVKKLIVKREAITSLSNYEQNRLRGAGSAATCTLMPTECMNDGKTGCIGNPPGYSEGCGASIAPNTANECIFTGPNPYTVSCCQTDLSFEYCYAHSFPRQCDWC